MFLNSKIQGEGLPVLLIHGLFGSLDNLGALAQRLAKEYTVYQIDLPNHGLSPPCCDLTYSAQAYTIKEFLVQNGLLNVCVIGHSMGGKIAMRLAIDAPSFVKKLVVIDIAPVKYETRRHDLIFEGLHACDNARIKSRKEADTLLLPSIEDSGVRQFLLKSLAKEASGDFKWRFNFKKLEERYEDILDWSENGVFFGPTLFIKGADSDYICPQYRPNIEQQFPHSKFHVVSNAGHWVHAEKPDTVARAITRFFTNAGR